MSKDKNKIDMTQGPIFSKLIKLSIPILLSGVLQLFFNAADIIVVGNFASDNSLAAVGSTNALINLLTNLFLGLSTGANVLISNYLGAREKERVNRTIHTAILLSIIFGIILNVIGVIFAKTFLLWMGTPSDVIGLSALYVRIYFFGMVAMLVYNFGSSILRSKGDTKRPLYFLLFAGVINVVLNLIFVIILKMDVAGVALATIISQFISAGLIITCLIKEEEEFKFSFKKLKLDTNIAKRLFAIGIPAGFQGVIFNLSNVVIQSSINSFGPIAMAGGSAAASLEGFVWISMNAFSQGSLTFMGQNIGAGKYSRLNKIAIIGCSCAAITGLVMGMSVYGFGPVLLSIYDKRESVITEGMIRLSLVCVFYFTCGLMDCLSAAIRGMGYALMPTIVSLIGACGLRLLWIFTIFRLEDFHSTFWLYFSYPVTWIISFFAHLVCYIIVRRKMPRNDLGVAYE